MNAKLTLRLDEQLIARAKAIGKAQGKSVSQLVAEYFAALNLPGAASAADDLPPGVRSLLGALEGREVNVEDYRDHLMEKYRGAENPSSR